MAYEEELRELNWILSKLNSDVGVFLLEDVVDLGKDYCVDDVHKWGMLVGCERVYGKIRDLIKVRIFQAVEKNKLDRGLAGEILKTYYYAPFKGRVEDVVDGWVLSDADRRMLERAGVYAD